MLNVACVVAALLLAGAGWARHAGWTRHAAGSETARAPEGVRPPAALAAHAPDVPQEGPPGRAADTYEPPPPPPPAAAQGAGPAALRPEVAARGVEQARRAIAALCVEAELFAARRGGYPSSAAPFGANRGIEALHAGLASLGRTHVAPAADTDGDGRDEYLDPWGRPYVYVVAEDYARSQTWGSGATATEVRAARAAGDGPWRAAAGFQIWSAGPDGRNDGGGGDDVTSWVVGD